jgi:hypothetical protein
VTTNDSPAATRTRRRLACWLAAEQHDIGMAALDAQPELNADTGLPQTFA